MNLVYSATEKKVAKLLELEMTILGCGYHHVQPAADFVGWISQLVGMNPCERITPVLRVISAGCTSTTLLTDRPPDSWIGPRQLRSLRRMRQQTWQLQQGLVPAHPPRSMKTTGKGWLNAGQITVK